MSNILKMLRLTRGHNRLDVTDVISYVYLFMGVIIMFGPIVWLVFSSFKTSGEIVKFPPRLLPYRQETVMVEGYEEPLPLYTITFEDGSTRILAQVRRVGLEAQMIDPAEPGRDHQSQYQSAPAGRKRLFWPGKLQRRCGEFRLWASICGTA